MTFRVVTTVGVAEVTDGRWTSSDPIFLRIVREVARSEGTFLASGEVPDPDAPLAEAVALRLNGSFLRLDEEPDDDSLPEGISGEVIY